ncbi:unnamed protein product [Polarella glacialis]|uniref:RING-type domain-containing protein n=1 Tax=Polarella glacialis TaxID=89957 RepID=A0A813LHV4_POLGL|nr:unnamed protein product [Polarella glacialis]
MAAGSSCPICREAILSESFPTVCGKCHQALHEECLQTGLVTDSRCPLCRTDLASAGYSLRGEVHHPERRRLSEQMRTAAFPTALFQELHEVVAGINVLHDQVQRHVRNPALIAGDVVHSAAVLTRRARALAAQVFSVPGLPQEVMDRLQQILADLWPILERIVGIVDTLLVESRARDQLAELDARLRAARDSARSAVPRSRQPRRSAPAPAAPRRPPPVRRRPAAATRAVPVRKRPAASISAAKRTKPVKAVQLKQTRKITAAAGSKRAAAKTTSRSRVAKTTSRSRVATSGKRAGQKVAACSSGKRPAAASRKVSASSGTTVRKKR